MGDQVVLTAEWRAKALRDELSPEEMREWIKLCREGRTSAAVASATSRARKAPVNLDDLMGELDNIK